jgi:site-specific DNA-methyltransferase (adenine-specific)
MPSPPVLTTSLGRLHRGDSLAWLSSLPAGCARLVVADPPYSIGRAAWDRFPSAEAYLEWSERWVREAHRILLPDGTLYICGYPEPIAHLAARVAPLFASWRSLVWFYRNKASLRADWGRSHESVLHLRKGRTMVFDVDAVRQPYNEHTRRYPEHPQAATSQYGSAPARPWSPHPAGARPRDVIEIPTLCNGSAEKTVHPTQKPVELIRRLVLASSRPGELVIDPFGGSGTTYAVCEETDRRWLGCERQPSYLRLIAARLRDPGRFRARQADESAPQRARRRARLRGNGPAAGGGGGP